MSDPEIPGDFPMQDPQLPWFPLYARDFVADFDVVGADLDAIGAYTLLLCYAWLKDGLADDERRIARVIGVTHGTADWKRLWGFLNGKFPVAEDGRRRNERQEMVREQQGAKAQRRTVLRAHRWGKLYAEMGEPAKPTAASRTRAELATIVGKKLKARTATAPAPAPSAVAPSPPTPMPPPPEPSSSGPTMPGGAPVATGPHRNHAICGRVCVPAFLHTKFTAKLGGPDADSRLRKWYGSVLDALSDEEPIAEGDVVFWESKFTEWVRRVNRGTGAGGSWRDVCTHVPPCDSYQTHEHAQIRDAVAEMRRHNGETTPAAREDPDLHPL